MLMASNVRDVDAPRAQSNQSRLRPDAAQIRERNDQLESEIADLLQQQVARLCKRLKKCAQDVQRVKAVHKLRTATRRVDAALRLFAPMLPDGRCRRLRKKVRKVRRAAGTPRDLDVLVARLAQDAHTKLDPLPLLAELRSRRASAADHLLDVIGSVDSATVKKQGRRLAHRVRWPSETSSGAPQSVADLLRPLLEDFRSASAEDLSSADKLHEFRKTGKRLRYAMELLGDVEPAAIPEGLPESLRDLQDQLGLINDHSTAIGVLTEAAADASDKNAADGAKAAAEAEQQAFEAGRHQFLKWWESRGRVQLEGRFRDISP